MKRIILALACIFTFAGCTLDWHVDRHCGPGTNRTCGPVATDYSEGHTSDVTIDVYYDICYDEPYYWSPEWCDWYSDGTTCCVWMADGWFEEWCQWDTDYCWEYNGSF